MYEKKQKMKEGIITHLGNRTKGSTHKNAIEANITHTGDEHLQLRKKLGHQDIYNCIVHRNKLSIKYNVGVLHMNKEKNLSPSQGLNLGLPNTSQMLLPLRHQDS